MKSIGPVLLTLAGLVLAWIALASDEPTFHVEATVSLPDSVPYALSGEVPVGCVVRTLDVEGICCGGCTGKLYLALNGLEEVQEVAIDPVLKRAKAVVPTGLDVALLEEALTFDKYSAHSVEGPGEAH